MRRPYSPVVSVAAWFVFKYVRRQLFLRRLRIARITPEAVMQKIAAGEDVFLLDLRTPLDVIAAPYVIPGARWITTDRIDEHLSEIPRDRELVVYFS